MTKLVQREFIYLWYYFDIQFRQIVGYWGMGILLGSLISVFGKTHIHKLLYRLQEKRMGVLGVIPASAVGILSPLCMYGTIPIAASFSQKGIKDDWLAAFMMSSILLNPQLMIYSAALGPVVLAIRIVSCFVCGVAAGLCVRLFFRSHTFFDFTGFEAQVNRDTDPNLFWRLVKNIWRNIKATGPYFLAGIMLSAIFQHYVPEQMVVRMFGNHQGFGILMAATIGVPLYVCGGGTIPLLQQWLADGMSLGAATAFMITGPATKITNLGALKIVLGFRHFVMYILFSMVFAFCCGILIQ